MTRRILTLIILLVWSAGLVGSAQPVSLALAVEPVALVYISLSSPDSLLRFESTGLPAYARLQSAQGEFLLAGADPAGQEKLTHIGLAYIILDPDIRGATYYLAHQMPGQSKITLSDYGVVLLDLGTQALLRASVADTERLSLAGAELQAITFDPKPLSYDQAPLALPEVISPDPLVQVMIDQVTETQIFNYDRELAGELPVWVDGEWYTITTRYTYSGIPIQKATSYVGQHLADLGLGVEYHLWNNTTNPNVIGEIPGLTNPDDIFIIGAHLDDVSGSPGADDNASGSVATLLAADILSQYQWGCTLRFAFWTGEEQGLYGSYAYAQRSYQQGENIVGYLNLDMIAYNTIGSSPGIDLLYNNSMPPTLQLAQLMADVIEAYDLNLVPELKVDLSGGSDHMSFWDYGYNSILAIEDQSDFNPYYHTPGDTPAHLDRAYFTEFVKASLGTFVHLNDCLIPSGVGHIEGTVSDDSTGLPIQGATVTAMDDQGHDFPTSTDTNGYFTRTLMSGEYTVTAWAYSYLTETLTNIQVLTDTVTPLTFSLQTAPSYTVSGTVTEVGTGIPLYAQVAFDGSPVIVWTDPASGFYQASLPQGFYLMKVRADIHRPEERYLMLDQDQTQDFALQALPCNLLVDDDVDDPNVRDYYTSALEGIGAQYNVWDTSTQGNPALQDLHGYHHILWFTGYPWSGTFNSDNETAVAPYLDEGGNFLLTSQDYLYEMGLTDFGQDYLHIGSYTNDISQHTVTGENVFGGLGPYSLTYPFTNYSDRVIPDGQSLLAFNGDQGNAAVSYEGDTFKTVFLGYPLEAVSLAGRQAILERMLDEYFAGCLPPTEADFTWQPVVPNSSQEITFTASAQGSEPISFAWDFGDQGSGYGQIITHTYQSGGIYTVTLTASNPYGQVDVLHPITVTGIPPEIVVTPQFLSMTLVAGDIYTAGLVIGNDGGSLLTFTLTDTQTAPWLDYIPQSGELTAGQSAEISLVLDTTGLSEGSYTTTLEVINNDPSQPIVPVPISLTVVSTCLPLTWADFTWQPVTPTMGTSVAFNATSNGSDPVTFDWDFGDGITATGSAVSHSFASDGIYTVALTGTNACSLASLSYEITVLPVWKVYLPLVSKQ